MAAPEQQQPQLAEVPAETPTVVSPEAIFPKDWSVLGGKYNRPDPARLKEIEGLGYLSRLPGNYPGSFFNVALYAFELSGLVKPDNALDARFTVLGRQATFSVLPAESATAIAQELGEASNDDLILDAVKERLSESAVRAVRIRQDYGARQELQKLTDPYEHKGRELVPVLRAVAAMRRDGLIGPISFWGGTDALRLEIAREKGLPFQQPPHLSSVE